MRLPWQSAQPASGSILNTPYKPDGFNYHRLMALQARAYYNLDPYPLWNFREWKTEVRGPYPRCMPFTRAVVRRGASWLFGKPLQITIPGNPKLQEFIGRMWLENRMDTRMVAGAEAGANDGSLILKWAFDERRKTPLAFQLLSPIDHGRAFFDPHDRDKLLMLRVQYPYFDPKEGKYFFYREEWTDEQFVVYKPIQAMTTSDMYREQAVGTNWLLIGSKDPDEYGGWTPQSTKTNPFRVIPSHNLVNLETNSPWGMGDLWSVLRIVDRINLAYHLMDRSNQFDSEPTPVYIDLVADKDALDAPVAPGRAVSLKTDKSIDDGEGKQGKIELIEPAGKLRPAMENYARDLRKMVLDAVGSAEVNQSEITNKGNLTQSVLAQLHGPLISSTEEKRKTYGDQGIARFLESCILGLLEAGLKRKIPGLDLVRPDNYDTYRIQLRWPDFFDMTEVERLTRIERFALEEEAGYLTHERAVRMVAATERIEDADKLVEEMKDWKPTVATEDATSKEIGKKWRSLKERSEAQNLRVSNKDGGPT